MRRVLMTALATAAIGIASTPAQAVTLQTCNGANCVSGTTNVNLVQQNAPGALTINGNVGVGGPGVTFNSTNGLLLADSGAATIFRPSDQLLTQLTFTMAAGFSFSKAEFNLLSGTPTSFDVTLSVAGNPNATQTLHLSNANGSNIFDIIGSGFESFTSATFTSTDGNPLTTDGGFNTFKQLRLVLATPGQAVPEPATWAMMLLGFGGIGMAMRRSRKSGRLLQVA